MWLAWQHDQQLIIDGVAELQPLWAGMWPDPAVLAAGVADLTGVTKAARRQRDEATIAAILAWLWSRMGSPKSLLDALTALVVEAQALGRRSALQALTAAGLQVPGSTQALDALDAARLRPAAATLAGTLLVSVRNRVRSLAVVLSAAVATGVTEAALTVLVRRWLADTSWLKRLAATTAWDRIGVTAATTYVWAGVHLVRWVTAHDSDVCFECDLEEDAGPRPIEDSPRPPDHPWCRCALYPVPDI